MPRKLPPAKQQGKPYDEDEKEKIIKSLKPYLTLGYDLKNACIMAQFTYETVWHWVKKDNTLLIQIQAWQNSVNAKARQNIAKAIEKGSELESKWWLERREKEFTTKHSNNIEPDELYQAKDEEAKAKLREQGLID